MGLHFVGGERIQRGRGVGGLLKLATKLFFPVAKIAQKALKSKTGQKIVNAVKDQAVNSSMNIANELIQGKSIKDSFSNELKTVKKKAKRKAVEIGVDLVNNQNKKIKRKKKKKKKIKSKSFKRDIFS